MKKKILLFSATTGILALALMSYQNGPAGSVPGGVGMNKTGALSSGSCADGGCHTAGGTATLGSFSKIVDKSNGWDVTTHGYIEGHTYTVTLQATNATLVNFGFQACALDVSQKQIGTLAVAAAQTAVRPTKLTSTATDTVYVVEHSSPLAAATHVLNVNFEWTAPPVGSAKGAAKFWGIANATNGMADNAGDAVSNTFSRNFANVTSVEDLRTTADVKVWPNPLVGDNRLKVELKNAPAAEYTIIAFDMQGRRMFNETYNSNVIPFEYNTSNWAPGMYHLQIITKDGMKHTTPLIKY